ncbi:hypothetical protein MRX96_006344 [Rhipicephalus microplus]
MKKRYKECDSVLCDYAVSSVRQALRNLTQRLIYSDYRSGTLLHTLNMDARFMPLQAEKEDDDGCAS